MRIWIDGKLVDRDEARVSVLDHGLLYGDGVFEGLRVIGGRVFSLDAHLARLAVGLTALDLAVDGGIGRIREAILTTAHAHGAPDCYLRLVVTRGVGPLGVDPTSCDRSSVFCIAAPLNVFPPASLDHGVALATASCRRPAPDVLDPRVKSLNYLNNALAKLEARRQGADEALLLNAQGLVAEASVANIFVVRDGELLTPPASDGALEGITRRTVLRLARELSIPAREKSLGRFDLFAATEAFLTGTGAGLVPVRALDRRAVGQPGPGEVFRRLLQAYRDFASSPDHPLVARPRTGQ